MSKTIIEALSKNEVDGVDGVRAYSGFSFDNENVKGLNCLELKMKGKWHPLVEPKFKTRKEALKVVREINKARKENNDDQSKNK